MMLLNNNQSKRFKPKIIHPVTNSVVYNAIFVQNSKKKINNRSDFPAEGL
jgi:hypothetical protein